MRPKKLRPDDRRVLRGQYRQAARDRLAEVAESMELEDERICRILCRLDASSPESLQHHTMSLELARVARRLRAGS